MRRLNLLLTIYYYFACRVAIDKITGTTLIWGCDLYRRGEHFREVCFS